MTKAVVIRAQQKWEYCTITRKTEGPLITELNILGQDGWELISVLYYKDIKGAMAWTGFLKRPASRQVGQPTQQHAGASMLEPSKTIQATAEGFDLSDDEFKLEPD